MKLKAVASLGLLAAAFLAIPQRLGAQAPPGPLPPPPESEGRPAERAPQPVAKPKPQLPPRTTLAGPWKLNTDDSDDPQRKVRAAEESTSGNSTGNRFPGGGYPGGGYPGGGYPGGGYPGGGYPGGGYPGGGGGRRNAEQDIQDNPKMQPLIHPADSLNVELKNPEVDVTDDQFHKLVVYTDGRQLPKPTDKTDKNEYVLAQWNGSRLVTDEKSPLGGKMSRTFELSQDGRKLTETLRIDNSRTKTPLVIAYVYDVASSDMPTDDESDPNRPVLKRKSDDDSGSSQ